MKKETLYNIAAVVVIFALIGWATSGEVGEQMANPKAYQFEQKVISEDTTICPDCLESNCIYMEINKAAKDATDTGIYDAVIKVCKKRGITNKKSIDTLLKEYYL